MTLSPMVKLITYHTPSHDALAARLLASEISEYRVMQVRGNQLGDGLFCGLGFRATVTEKVKAIRREASEWPHMDFVFADADVVFLRPSLATLDMELEGYDAIFQDDGIELCTGLFAMRYNQRCLEALDRWVTEMEREPENDIDHDQSILNRILPQTDLKVTRFSHCFANLYTLTGESWHGQDIVLPPETIAFHANFCMGTADKQRLIEMAMHPSTKRRMLIKGRKDGLFSVFLGTIDNLLTAERDGMDAWVEWGPECHAYYAGSNVWMQFFEQPLLSTKPETFDVICDNFGDPLADECYYAKYDGGYGTRTIQDARFRISACHRKEIHNAIKRLARIKANCPAFEKFQAFRRTLPEEYVCIHIRGTDRHWDAELPSLEYYLSVLHYFRDKTIVVCTDSHEALTEVRRVFPEARAYDSIRRDKYGDDVGIHTRPQEDHQRIAEDAFVEMLIMASSKILIHSGSNMATT